ncbi:hypothetical protein BD311DRAFT_741122 [Dichomitus squalens]|uniref:Uncharacterized protein n=1 Tax=Dichomitus squalens TaxID=114155 RepID=A0A4Q9MHE1_9APHY|nr:hypothetical protein BD311DRAFT_741122 [Dichomitus squalens]
MSPEPEQIKVNISLAEDEYLQSVLPDYRKQGALEKANYCDRRVQHLMNMRNVTTQNPYIKPLLTLKVRNWFTNHSEARRACMPYKLSHNFNGVRVFETLHRTEILERKAMADRMGTHHIRKYTSVRNKMYQELTEENREELEQIAQEWNTSGPDAQCKPQIAETRGHKWMRSFMEMVWQQAGIFMTIRRISGARVRMTTVRFSRTMCHGMRIFPERAGPAENDLPKPKGHRSKPELFSFEHCLDGSPILVDQEDGCPMTHLRRQEVIRQWFTEHWSLAIGIAQQSIPWTAVTANPSAFIDPSMLPVDFRFKDTSKWTVSELAALYPFLLRLEDPAKFGLVDVEPKMFHFSHVIEEGWIVPARYPEVVLPAKPSRGSRRMQYSRPGRVAPVADSSEESADSGKPFAQGRRHPRTKKKTVVDEDNKEEYIGPKDEDDLAEDARWEDESEVGNPGESDDELLNNNLAPVDQGSESDGEDVSCRVFRESDDEDNNKDDVQNILVASGVVPSIPPPTLIAPCNVRQIRHFKWATWQQLSWCLPEEVHHDKEAVKMLTDYLNTGPCAGASTEDLHWYCLAMGMMLRDLNIIMEIEADEPPPTHVPFYLLASKLDSITSDDLMMACSSRFMKPAPRPRMRIVKVSSEVSRIQWPDDLQLGVSQSKHILNTTIPAALAVPDRKGKAKAMAISTSDPSRVVSPPETPADDNGQRPVECNSHGHTNTNVDVIPDGDAESGSKPDSVSQPPNSHCSGHRWTVPGVLITTPPTAIAHHTCNQERQKTQEPKCVI